MFCITSRWKKMLQNSFFYLCFQKLQWCENCVLRDGFVRWFWWAHSRFQKTNRPTLHWISLSHPLYMYYCVTFSNFVVSKNQVWASFLSSHPNASIETSTISGNPQERWIFRTNIIRRICTKLFLIQWTLCWNVTKLFQLTIITCIIFVCDLNH